MANTNIAVHPTFSIDMHHRYKIGGDEWRFAYETNGTVTFSAIADAHRKLTYDVGTLNRLNGAGMIEVYTRNGPGEGPAEAREHPFTMRCIDRPIEGTNLNWIHAYHAWELI